jgi:uncharacterized membrane protein YkoI
MRHERLSAVLQGSFTVLLVCLFLQGCSAIGGKKDKEQVVALDQAPAAVRDSVTKTVGSNKLDRLTRESEDGKVVYEAEYHANGVKHSLSVRETGEVIEDEQPVAVADLPPAVSKAVSAKHPDGTLAEAELVEAGGQKFYEVVVRVGKPEREVKVNAAGQILADEAEEHEEKDKD